MQAFHHQLLFFPAAPPRLPPTSSFSLRRGIIATPTAFTTSSPKHPAFEHLEPDSPSAAFQDYQLLFASQRAECPVPLALRAVGGTLPADFPRGTYYLVGPGVITDDHGSTVNPLDGHGYLRAFRFLGGGADGNVLYSARYVETQAVMEEREDGGRKWRFVRPGFFSLLKARRWPALCMLKPKNVANTCVLRWGGRLFCLWDGGHPYELDPESLSTIGPVDFASAAEEGVDRLKTSEGFLQILFRTVLGNAQKRTRTVAHCKIDALRKRLLVLYFNVEDLFLHQSNLTFCEFDSDFELKQRKAFLVPAQMLVHDWGFTEAHYIVIANSVKLHLPGSLKALCGQAPMVSAVSTNPSQPTTPIYLLPRFSDTYGVDRDWRIPVEAPSRLWISHVGNAFEERDRSGNAKIQIQASVSSYEWWRLEKLFGYDFQSPEFDPSVMNVADPEKTAPHLVEVSIDLDAKGSCLGCSVANCSSQWSKLADFPVINPTHSGRQNRFLYASSASGSRKFLPFYPPDTVAKLDLWNRSVKTWMPGKRSFVGEPLFVSRGTGEEEDGYVLVVEYAVFKQRCYLVVLDAKRIGQEDAVVAKLQVPKHLRFPSAFHGFWDCQ